MLPYDWHFDRDNNGELDYHERLNQEDYFFQRGIYAPEEVKEDEWDEDEDHRELDEDEW